MRVVFVQDVFVDELFGDEEFPALTTLPLGVSNALLLLFELYIEVVSLCVVHFIIAARKNKKNK